MRKCKSINCDEIIIESHRKRINNILYCKRCRDEIESMNINEIEQRWTNMIKSIFNELFDEINYIEKIDKIILDLNERDKKWL